MFENLKRIYHNPDYRTVRAFHISIVFAFSFLAEMMLQMPRGAWTAFTVMMIYAGFDVGTSIQRVIHRFLGVILGLLSARLIWLIGHIDYRTLYLIVPVLVGFYYYLLGKPYMYPTIFTVILSLVGSDYFFHPDYFVAWFFIDYSTCTIVAVVICLVFEYFIFKKINMTRLFFIDLQKSMITCVKNLFNEATRSVIRKGAYIDATVALNKKVIELRTFVQNTKNDYHNTDNLIEELDTFTFDVNLAYQNIRKIFILKTKLVHSPFEQSIFEETQRLIQQLEALLSKEKAEEKVIEGLA